MRMLWCCDPLEPLRPEDSKASASFPGQRRLVKTGGNALAEASTTASENAPLQIAPSDVLVSVLVPQGYGAGDTLIVRSPDGLRTVHAAIPEGLTAGDTFLVKFQPAGTPVPKIVDASHMETREELAPQAASVNAAAPVAASDEKSVFSDALGKLFKNSQSQEKGQAQTSEALAEAVAEPVHETLPQPVPAPMMPEKVQLQSNMVKKVTGEPVNATVENAQAVESRQTVMNKSSYSETLEGLHMSSTDAAQIEVQNRAPKDDFETLPEQKVLLVYVPPGISPGSTIYVEIPGENRTLAAQVPPGNVKSFHVAYTPSPKPHVAPPKRNVHFFPRGPPPPQQAPSTFVPTNMSTPGQKLLLVRVPTGTPAGTTLHVSVPDEPGRILAAQVPPGNVREFHVSYESRPQPVSVRGMLPPANAYAKGNALPSQTQQASSSRQGGGAGDYLFPILGGAALGAAGIAAYEHFAHQNNNSNAGFDDTTAPDAGDYGDAGYDGGADYGDYGGADGGDFGDGFDF